MPVLISKNAVYTEELREEFSFVMHAPILNGNKFKGLRVHRGLPRNEDVAIVKKYSTISVTADPICAKGRSRRMYIPGACKIYQGSMRYNKPMGSESRLNQKQIWSSDRCTA